MARRRPRGSCRCERRSAPAGELTPRCGGALTPTPPADERSQRHADGSRGPLSLKTTVGGLRRTTVAPGASVQRAGRWVWGLAGFDAVAGGDDVVVVARVEEAAPGAAGGRGDEAAVGSLFADELDVVGEVGAEEGVLAGAGGGDAGVGDVAGPLEGGVEARGGEGGVGVAVLAGSGAGPGSRSRPRQATSSRRRAAEPGRTAGARDDAPSPLAGAIASNRAIAASAAQASADAAAARPAAGPGRGPGPGPGSAGRTRSRAASPRGRRRRSGRPARRGRRRGRPGRRATSQHAGSAPRPRQSERGRPSASGDRAAARGRQRPSWRPGQEPVRPDRAVGQVAEDAVGFAAAERLLRAPAARSGRGVDPGQRVAGVDEVAQVPVAAAGQRGEAGDRERAPPLPARRDRARGRRREPRRAGGS